jgi:hypothetical protein
VASFDKVPGPEPVDPDYVDPDYVDPDYAGLFREGGAAPSVSHSDEPADPVDAPAVEVSASALDAESAVEELPAVEEESAVDTGRLFRSQGVRGFDAAVLALSSDHGGRLRTLTRTDVESVSAAAPVTVSALLTPDQDPAQPPASSAASRPLRAARSATGRSITGRAVYLLVIGVTLIVAFINALLANGDIGWPTGVALVLVTVYCALSVRREDDVVAIITPPLAYFLVAITAAQLFLGSAERSLFNRAVVTFFTLADNWIWIIGATLAALVIVIIRRRR